MLSALFNNTGNSLYIDNVELGHTMIRANTVTSLRHLSVALQPHRLKTPLGVADYNLQVMIYTFHALRCHVKTCCVFLPALFPFYVCRWAKAL